MSNEELAELVVEGESGFQPEAWSALQSFLGVLP